MHMNTWIAFFRGINVGGRSILPMKDLVSIFIALGFEDVITYIQSGNVIFRSPQEDARPMAERITEAVKKKHGLNPRVVLLKLAELEAAVVANPYPTAEVDPKSLHLYFLSEVPENPDFESMEKVKSASESYTMAGKIFYLHAPDGVGRSRLAARAETLLGVEATARNWRTVTQALKMAKENR